MICLFFIVGFTSLQAQNSISVETPKITTLDGIDITEQDGDYTAREKCTVEYPIEGFGWNYEDGERASDQPINEELLIRPGRNGFMIDIFELDNSFNLKINGVYISNEEIEFAHTDGLERNIRFSDGSFYGDDGIADIWDMTGESGQPIIRVRVDSDGNVRVLGTRAMGNDYELEDLEVFDRSTNSTIPFNTVTIVNKSRVKVQQNIEGKTTFVGESFLYKMENCPVCNNKKVYMSVQNGREGLQTISFGSENFTLIGDAPNNRYNAIGLNPQDNFIYAIESLRDAPSNHLLRIHPQRGFTIDMGPVSGLPIDLYKSGTFDRDGNYYVASLGSVDHIYKISISESGTLRAAEKIGLDKTTNVNDFAFVDYNGAKLYGVKTGGYLVEIDLESGLPHTVTVHTEYPADPGNYGGVYWKISNNMIRAYNGATGDMWAFDLDTFKSHKRNKNIGIFKNTDMANCITGNDDDDDDPIPTKSGLSQQAELYQFSFQPNPVRDILNITSSKKIESVKVYNMANLEVLSLNSTRAENGKVDLSGLQQGMYIVRTILEGGQVETFKVVKR